MLYLHCLVWLCDTFHMTKLHKWLQVDFENTACIVEFIDYIIRYFIITKDEANISESDTLSIFFVELDSSLVLKLDINSNSVVKKCQMHLSTYNTIWYKYNTIIIDQYRIDFLHPINR